MSASDSRPSTEQRDHKVILQVTAAHVLTLPVLEHSSLSDRIISALVSNLPTAESNQKVRQGSSNFEGTGDVEVMDVVSHPGVFGGANVLEFETVQVGELDVSVFQQLSGATAIDEAVGGGVGLMKGFVNFTLFDGEGLESWDDQSEEVLLDLTAVEMELLRVTAHNEGPE